MSEKNTLSVFDFNEAPLRVSLGEDGQPWFVAADVCRVLEISNSRDAVSALDEDEKATVGNPDTRPGQPGAKVFNVVSESGLYALIFKSRKAAAKAFRKWVTAQVLPALRQTGRYEAAGAAAPVAAPGAPWDLGAVFEQGREASAGLLAGRLDVKAAGMVLRLGQECRRAYALHAKAMGNGAGVKPVGGALGGAEEEQMRELLTMIVAQHPTEPRGKFDLRMDGILYFAENAGYLPWIAKAARRGDSSAQIRFGKLMLRLLAREMQDAHGRRFAVYKRKTKDCVLYSFVFRREVQP